MHDEPAENRLSSILCFVHLFILTVISLWWFQSPVAGRLTCMQLKAGPSTWFVDNELAWLDHPG